MSLAPMGAESSRPWLTPWHELLLICFISFYKGVRYSMPLFGRGTTAGACVSVQATVRCLRTDWAPKTNQQGESEGELSSLVSAAVETAVRQELLAGLHPQGCTAELDLNLGQVNPLPAWTGSSGGGHRGVSNFVALACRCGGLAWSSLLLPLFPLSAELRWQVDWLRGREGGYSVPPCPSI